MQSPYTLVLSLLLSSSCLASEEPVLQFHIVQPEGNGKMAANIAPEGVRQDGSIVASHNPNSIIYQHRKMMEDLAQEDQNLKIEQENETAEQPDTSLNLFSGQQSLFSSSQKPVPGNIFSSNRANKTVLQELIELEKRAGRAKPDSQ